MSATTDRIKKAERTSEVAFGIINAEAAARQAKTAKLKKLREALEEEAAEPKQEKPAARKRAPARRSRRVGP